MRKTVTVIFSDVVGSSGLGERLDPEQLRQVMSRYYEWASGALRRHGGRVEKFIGDAVVAVFGVPVLREDDALRAVRAAAELRSGLAELNAELRATTGSPSTCGTGVNTGEVVVGDAVVGQDIALGDVVNVAARLEQIAAPGEVLLGERTYRLVRDAVTADLLAPITLKGKGIAVVIWRLLAVKPGVAGHARRLDAPMVGPRPGGGAASAGVRADHGRGHVARCDPARGSRGGQVADAARAARPDQGFGHRPARTLPRLRRGNDVLAADRGRPPGGRRQRHRRPRRGSAQGRGAGPGTRPGLGDCAAGRPARRRRSDRST